MLLDSGAASASSIALAPSPLDPALESAAGPILNRATVLRRVFSFPVTLCALLTVLALCSVRERFNDPDMWWHLRTGEIIWTTHHIPTVDLFSYTTHSARYIPHEWLAQVLIYGAYFMGGNSGLMLALALGASAIVVVGYVLCWLYSGNAKVAFAGAFGIWIFATVGMSIRPQLIGYLFLSSELLLITLARRSNPKLYLLLPILFATWVNCHGSFLLGLLVLAIALVCSSLDLRIGGIVSTRSSRRSRLLLGSGFALSILALLINPIGLKQVTYPIDTMFAQSLQKHSITEWQPAPLSDPRALLLLGLAGLALLIPVMRRIDLRLEELLIVGLGFGLAAEHQRMLFVFGILAMPVLSRLLATSWEQYDPSRDDARVNAGFIALAGGVALLIFPSGRNLQAQVTKQNPVGAVEYLNRSGFSGRMLNDYGYGGYLIWAARKQKVFVDGRGDVFEWTGVLGDYMNWLNLQAEPRQLLNRYRIDLCLLPRQASAVKVLELLPEWRESYSDDLSIVFERRRP